MKKLFLLLAFLICAMKADAAYITATISITNTPANGATIANGADVRTWTTGSISTPATQILVVGNNILNASNLFYQTQQYPFSGVSSITWDGVSSNIVYAGISPLSLTLSSGYAKIVYTTNSANGILPVEVNASGVVAGMTFADASNQVAMASGVVAGINASATNAFATNTPAVTNLVDLFNAQSVYNKILFLVSIYSGTISNVYITNALSISGMVSKLTNGTFYGDPNFVDSGAGSVIYSNLSGDSFNVDIPTGGELDFVYGGPLSSHIYTFDGPLFAPSYTGVISPITIASGTITNAIGLTNVGNLFRGTLSNIVSVGTNGLNGVVYSTRFNNTALANGNNQDVNLGTNVITQFSGLTGAFGTAGFVGGIDDRICISENATVQTWTINNQSGFESTPANRILTGTGADVVLSSNSFAMFKYDSAVSRWKLLFASGAPSSGGSGTFSGNWSGSFIVGAITNVPSFTVVNTNWNLATYTNQTGRTIEVCGNAVLTTAAVVGYSQLALQVPGSVTNYASVLTAIGGLTGAMTNAMTPAFVTNGGTFIWASTGSGAGNTATPWNGQYIVH